MSKNRKAKLAPEAAVAAPEPTTAVPAPAPTTKDADRAAEKAFLAAARADAHAAAQMALNAVSRTIECGCGCGAMVPIRRFVPGHDAKLKSRVLKEAVERALAARAAEDMGRTA